MLVIAVSADLKVKRFGDIGGGKITEAIEIEGLESFLTSYSLYSVRTRCLQADSVHVFQKGIGNSGGQVRLYSKRLNKHLPIFK